MTIMKFGDNYFDPEEVQVVQDQTGNIDPNNSPHRLKLFLYFRFSGSCVVLYDDPANRFMTIWKQNEANKN